MAKNKVLAYNGTAPNGYDATTGMPMGMPPDPNMPIDPAMMAKPRGRKKSRKPAKSAPKSAKLV